MSAPISPVRLRPEIAEAAAYRQGRPAPAHGYKLSSNENPFETLPAIARAVEEASAFNRYPGDALALRRRLAERHGLDVGEVLVGAGSVALLTQFVAAAAGPGDEVVYAWRSFEAYPGLVTVSGAAGVPVPLQADGRHDLETMAAAVTERTRVVIVCTPNNPTGPIVTADEFEAFLTAVPDDRLVLLDEAYAEFVTDPAAVRGAPLLARHRNLVVLRTFSKAYGLAGLRIGYALGNERVLGPTRAAAIPMSVTDQAVAGALAALDHEAELLERVAVLVQRRDAVRSALLAQGWAVPEAEGNFVWLPTGEATAEAEEAFFDAGLVVRAFAGEGVRISIGEPESVDTLVSVASGLVPKPPRADQA